MVRIEFSEAEVKALNHERYHHPHPRVQRKVGVLWLKSQGLAHKEIARLSGVCATTLIRYLREYQQGALARLTEIRFRRPVSELSGHRATLETYFRVHPPASVKEAMAKIEALTGLQRSENRVREFLKSLGMACRKVGMIPAKADGDKQEAFKKKR